MMKFCTVCKKVGQCYYCAKYGNKGVYIQLEKMSREQNKKKVPTIDIHKIQLAIFTKD
jgi:hypothetical protein